MCVVSMVVGPWTNPVDPNYIPFTKQSPSASDALQMLRVIQLLEAIDKKMGALDCKVEQIAKEKFKRKLKRRAKQPSPSKRVTP